MTCRSTRSHDRPRSRCGRGPQQPQREISVPRRGDVCGAVDQRAHPRRLARRARVAHRRHPGDAAAVDGAERRRVDLTQEPRHDVGPAQLDGRLGGAEQAASGPVAVVAELRGALERRYGRGRCAATPGVRRPPRRVRARRPRPCRGSPPPDATPPARLRRPASPRAWHAPLGVPGARRLVDGAPDPRVPEARSVVLDLARSADAPSASASASTGRPSIAPAASKVSGRDIPPCAAATSRTLLVGGGTPRLAAKAVSSRSESGR